MQYTPPKRSLSTTHVGCVRKFLEKLIGGRGGRSNGRFAGSLIPSAAVFMPPVSRFPQGFPQGFLKVSSRLLQGFLILYEPLQPAVLPHFEMRRWPRGEGNTWLDREETLQVILGMPIKKTLRVWKVWCV